MTLRIITPSAKPLEARASKVFFPGLDGSFEVLRGHAPMIAALTEGSIRWETEGGEQGSFQIRSGFVHVEKDTLECCVEQ